MRWVEVQYKYYTYFSLKSCNVRQVDAKAVLQGKMSLDEDSGWVWRKEESPRL